MTVWEEKGEDLRHLGVLRQDRGEEEIGVWTGVTRVVRTPTICSFLLDIRLSRVILKTTEMGLWVGEVVLLFCSVLEAKRGSLPVFGSSVGNRGKGCV